MFGFVCWISDSYQLRFHLTYCIDRLSACSLMMRINLDPWRVFKKWWYTKWLRKCRTWIIIYRFLLCCSHFTFLLFVSRILWTSSGTEVNVMDPSFKVYAPWRDPVLLEEFPGRTQMLSFLQKHLGWSTNHTYTVYRLYPLTCIYTHPWKIRRFIKAWLKGKPMVLLRETHGYPSSSVHISPKASRWFCWWRCGCEIFAGHHRICTE